MERARCFGIIDEEYQQTIKEAGGKLLPHGRGHRLFKLNKPTKTRGSDE